MNEQYLEHHGVKGMKWGVRRYQNEDGTLTDIGRRRLGLSEEESSKLSKEKTHNIAYQNAMADYGSISKAFNAGTAAARSGSNYHRRKANKKRDKYARTLDVSQMSDQDLQRAVNRMNLEQNYKRLKSGTIRTGSDKVADVLDTVGDISVIGASAATIALTILAIRRGSIPSYGLIPFGI